MKSVDKAAKIYTEILPLEISITEAVGELRTSFVPMGQAKLELVMSTEPDGTMAKFIEKKGEGLHRLAFDVHDIEAAVEELKAKGVPMTAERPWKGAHDAKVMFLHPKATHGVLIELCQYPEDH
ncbi:methylmalonyl-CoA epimerase [Desulfoferula mesophila]|uniref:methylmalonyl-CoA epimerase n=1 Tax=Desulfoferula mesophila TaxID=3058419 RepID=UPI003D9C7740